ncbi:hypothetical protein SAMN05192558_104308 [Actinokineospora alba]|uniref:Hemophore-related protein, Rv0203/Rv1174c family n=1 Tax=Actinokineospora alba TaxID=504798 RepID=A0A1H0LWL1_9PSEU|nr:hypothetical protein [Actinokineospora alba]TDP67480.1 hypothetical protein C8E96_3025 [Actinokineospora alba]SDI47248.1 hypothetical protein SAMN05421871_105152 [Actinokineospora alba]SDO72356.1 hypothetical protein SAMN05192558_104308 [Actinokineospora alba]
MRITRITLALTTACAAALLTAGIAVAGDDTPAPQPPKETTADLGDLCKALTDPDSLPKEFTEIPEEVRKLLPPNHTTVREVHVGGTYPSPDDKAAFEKHVEQEAEKAAEAHPEGPEAGADVVHEHVYLPSPEECKAGK